MTASDRAPGLPGDPQDHEVIISTGQQFGAAGRVPAPPAVSVTVAQEQQGGFDAVGAGRARRRDEAQVEFNRIVAFSDGVFAIAITLLVLGLTIPGGLDDSDPGPLEPEGRSARLRDQLRRDRKVLGRPSPLLRGAGALRRALMGINLIYLAFMVLIPFTSQVLGDYGGQRAAVILYAINLACVSLAFRAQIMYATEPSWCRAGGPGRSKRRIGRAGELSGGERLLALDPGRVHRAPPQRP